MKVSVQVVFGDDDESQPHVVREVFSLERSSSLAPDSTGLALAEARDILSSLQEALVAEQVKEALAAQASCPHCGTRRRHKDSRQIVLRTLFGTLHLPSPRWMHCGCSPQPTRTFSPLAGLLPERATPELVYLETKFAGLMSYGLSARLLAESSRSGGRCTRPRCASTPRRWPNAWRTSSAPSR